MSMVAEEHRARWNLGGKIGSPASDVTLFFDVAKGARIGGRKIEVCGEAAFRNGSMALDTFESHGLQVYRM
jgi:hypothetical protein